MTTLKLLHLENTPIFRQLQIEEALLRNGDDNYCLLNTGSPKAIVMGISGKPEELISDAGLKQNIPIIRRFSGGGTVAIDENTLFVTFIFNKGVHNFTPFPEPIFRWTETIYKDVFPKPFSLKENDYTFGDKKFGGNAQYIKRDRWLHHTTFLWDYDSAHMNLLKIPQKAPDYRQKRDHSEFLCTLREHFSAPSTFIEKLRHTLHQQYVVCPIALEEIAPYLEQSHRQSVRLYNQAPQ